jgi:hypothetical protein
MSSLVTAPERSVIGKITRSGLDTRKSRPPAPTIMASDAAMPGVRQRRPAHTRRRTAAAHPSLPDSRGSTGLSGPREPDEASASECPRKRRQPPRALLLGAHERASQTTLRQPPAWDEQQHCRPARTALSVRAIGAVVADVRRGVPPCGRSYGFAGSERAYARPRVTHGASWRLVRRPSGSTRASLAFRDPASRRVAHAASREGRRCPRGLCAP